MLDNSGMNTINPNKVGNIPQFMIDDLDLSDCDLIWLDLEGYELQALAGALNTIEKFNPVIMAERANQDVVKYLSRWGYKQIDTSNLDCIFKVQ